MKILKITKGKNNPDNYGNYSFWLSIENEEKSFLLRQKNPECQFKESDSIPDDWIKAIENYTNKEGKQVEYYKLTAPKKEFNKGFAKPKANNASFALSYSKDIAVAFIAKAIPISNEQILDTAEIFLNWLNRYSND